MMFKIILILRMIMITVETRIITYITYDESVTLTDYDPVNIKEAWL